MTLVERVFRRFLASRGVVFRPEGWQACSDDVIALGRSSYLYRGMTEPEWRFIQSRGFIQSNMSYSHSSEGTNFADDIADAESYVDFGRDDPRKSGRPNYLIEIPKLPHITRARDGYWKTMGPVPKSEITRAWKIVAEDGALVGYPINP